MSTESVRSVELLAAALDAAGDLAYAWELDRDAIEWSGRLGQSKPGFTVGITTGRLFAENIHPDDQGRRQSMLAIHLNGHRDFDCEYRLRDAGGGFAWVHERGRALRDADGRPHKMFGVIRAVGESKTRRSHAEHLANYDELTGHFNRSRLREAVDLVITDNRRAPGHAMFLAVGIDNLSAIDSSLGAAASEGVLIEIGRRLDTCVRVSDRIGRLGSDRFGVVLAHCPAVHVASAADKILTAVRAAPIATPDGPVFATVSIGGVSLGESLTSYDVITRAEAALAEAERAGRDCFVHYRANEEQRGRQSRSTAVGDAVQVALRQDRVRFAFQPIVSARTGKVAYHECLLRLRDAGDGMVPAGDFVRDVERIGLIRLIDRHILDKVIAEAVAHPGITLGFNISALTAADRLWLRALTAQLRAHPGLAERLIVEITETAALYDIEESVRFVAALRRAGCRVALDDFGAGHTSLQHLHSLAVDTVKIDRSFVSDIASSPENQIFLRHLLGLAKGFGFSTVAEGVETATEAEVLRCEGVDFLQGHYFGHATTEPPWRLAAEPAA
ncbi:MAG TPA: EAL domain-containing protein [Stellaceae bacterium]|nr:EAL domain-containing protein [Stellaceae bacterium]